MYGKPLDLIDLDLRKRICSNCALFGDSKGHNIRPMDQVIEEISVRSEALAELSKIIA